MVCVEQRGEKVNCMSVTAQVSLCLQVSLQKVHVDIGFRRETRERQTAVISVLRREHGGVEVCPVGMLKIRITDLRGGGGATGIID